MAARFPQSPLQPELADRVLERKDYLKIDTTISSLGSTARAATTEKPTYRVRLVE